MSALMAASLAPAHAETIKVYAYATGGTEGVAVSALEDGKFYAIRDCEGNRNAFRYVDLGSTYVNGNHNDASSKKVSFSANYVWQAIADGENWKFKNVSEDAYLPAATGDQGNIYLTSNVENAGVFSIIAKDNNQFQVKNPNADSSWDGDAAPSYSLSYWHGTGHPYEFYELSESGVVPLGLDNIYRLKYIASSGDFVGNALDMQVNLEGESLGAESNNAFLSDSGSDVVFSFSNGDYSRCQIKSLDDYTFKASSWNCVATDKTEFYWSLMPVEESFDTENIVISLYQNTATYDPNNPGDMAGYAEPQNTTHGNGLLYSNRATPTYWEVVRSPNVIDVEFTVKLSDTDENPYTFSKEMFINDEIPSVVGFDSQEVGTMVSATNTSVTYVLKENSPMRIYNERKDTYICVRDNALYEVKGHKNDNTIFQKIAAEDGDGGFYLYNPATGMFVGAIVSANDPTKAVSFLSTPQKFYTDRYSGETVEGVYYPIYADWIGTTKAGENDGQHWFFNDYQGNFVCGYKRVDDGSKWVIVTNQENFEENWAMRQSLMDARPLYEVACEKLGETPDQTLLDFANNFRFNGDVNLPVSDEAKTNLQTLISKVETAEKEWPATIMNATKLYTIVSVDAGRGALVYDPEEQCMTTAATVNEGDDNHLWGFVSVGDKFYLYNGGALKFASAYIPHKGTSATGAVYAWTVGDVPTAIELSNEAFGASEAFDNNKFVIKGGKEGTINPAGMMIINGYDTKIPCSLGHHDITDGTGFILTAVKDAPHDQTMKDKVKEGFDKVNDLIDEMSVVLDGEDYLADVHGKQVGHYQADAVSTFGTELSDAKELEDKEEAMYAALAARNKFDTAERVAVIDQNVYTISDSEGNIHYTDGTSHLKEGFSDDMDQKLKNWVATVKENGTVSFSHTHESDAEVSPAMLYDVSAINFMAGDDSEFTVNPTSKPGVVTLGSDATEYVISHVSADAKDAETTGIESIEASIVKADAIYDLQGRKVAKAAKGLYIVNGKKVLVK